MKHRPAVVVVVMLGLLISAGCSNTKWTSNPLSEAGMREIVVDEGDVLVQFTVNGVAEAVLTRVRSASGGVVKSTYVRLGEYVAEGHKLIELDQWEQRARLDAALLKYAEAELRLEKAAATYATQLETEKNRVESLANQLKTQEMQYRAMLAVKEAYSQQELEIKRMAFEGAQASHSAALKAYESLLANASDFDRAERLALKAAQAEIASAQRSLERTVITSPTSGLLAQFNLNPGDVVAANQEVGVITNDKVTRVTARILELDLPSVSIGQEVAVTFAALPDEKLPGTVVAIDVLPASSGTDYATFKVTIELTAAHTKVRSGMTCAVDFMLEQALGVTCIPSAAIIELDEKFYVQMKGADNTLGLRQVHKGLDNGRRVEIVRGLVPGEKIYIKLPTK